MAQCRRCGGSGWFLRVDPQGFCSKCQSAVRAEIADHGLAFSQAFAIVRSSGDTVGRLSALDRMELSAKALMMFADMGMPVDPSPRELLAEIEEIRRAIIAETVPPPAPAQTIIDTEPAPRRQRSRQARITAKSRLLFLDVETTGLSADDRIVSLGMARCYAADLLAVSRFGVQNFNLEVLHLVFNPERPSNPMARRVHGWTDDVLARQPSFAAHSATIMDMLESADVWLAHNALFDMRFIKREFARLNRVPRSRPVYCTMEKAQAEWSGETARLDHCLDRIGLKRTGERHGALEDALLCASLFVFFRTGRSLSLPECPPPSNFVG